jgi:hypothetical protein
LRIVNHNLRPPPDYPMTVVRYRKWCIKLSCHHRSQSIHAPSTFRTCRHTVPARLPGRALTCRSRSQPSAPPSGSRHCPFRPRRRSVAGWRDGRLTGERRLCAGWRIDLHLRTAASVSPDHSVTSVALSSQSPRLRGTTRRFPTAHLPSVLARDSKE